MERNQDPVTQMNRRAFLCRAGATVGTAALWSLLEPRVAEGMAGQGSSLPAASHGIISQFHYPPRIKRVIQLYMAGGPSHLETFDYKPNLAQMHGQPMPDSLTKGQPIAQLQNAALKCFGPQHSFNRCGKSGQEISEVFPLLGQVADELCIIRSLHTEAINHDPAHTYINTGTTISGRPSMGSWLLYGLGTDSRDLPGFVVLVSTGKFGQAQPISARQWHSGFLESRFQGIEFRSQGDPVMYAGRPAGINAARQKDVVDAVKELNRLENAVVSDPEIATRISQYELAFQMQTSVPDLMDISKESKSTLELYGTTGGDGSFSANCLLARRLAERGVRFIQLYHRDWDHHGAIKRDVAGTAKEVDRGMYALLTDLKARGMLDDTLVMWNGEFGRTPMAQGDGRDHHMKAFSVWLAGGGVKGGLTYGATDEFGYNAVEDVVHVNDLHATILRLFGIDHKRLTYRFQGRDFRITDVAGNVIDKILA